MTTAQLTRARHYAAHNFSRRDTANILGVTVRELSEALDEPRERDRVREELAATAVRLLAKAKTAGERHCVMSNFKDVL
jgi:hypothetical protein